MLQKRRPPEFKLQGGGRGAAGCKMMPAEGEHTKAVPVGGRYG